MAAASNKRIAKNTIFLYVNMAFAMLVGLYTSRVVLAVLGEQNVGIYSVAGGVVMLFAFMNGAMSASTARFITFELGGGNFDRLHKTFCTSLLNHVFIAVLLLLLAESVGLYFFHKLVIPPDRMDAAMIVYQISILTALLSFLQTPYIATITAHEKMNAFAAIGIADVCLKLLCVLSLKYISSSDNLIFYAILMFTCSSIITSLYIFYCRRKFSECRNFIFGGVNLHKKLFAYSAWDLLGCFSSIAQGQGLNVLLNLFFGPVINTARTFSVQVQGYLSQFVGNFIVSVRPQIIKLYAEEKVEAMLKLTCSSAKYGFALILLFSMPVFFEINYVLYLWLGDVGDVPEHTDNFCRIMLLMNFIETLRRPFVNAIHATGRIKLGNLICGPILIAALPLSYISLKIGFPPESVFCITLAINIIVQFIETFIVKKYAGLKWSYYLKFTYLPSMFHLAFVGIPLYFIHQNMNSSSIFNLFLLCVYSFIFSLTGTYFLLTSKETKVKIWVKFEEFRNLINKKLK